MLKDETDSQQLDIMNMINPLQIMNRLSQRTIEQTRKTQSALMIQGNLDAQSRMELSILAQSRMSVLPEKALTIEEKMAHLMTKNLEQKDNVLAREATSQLFKKQLDSMASITNDYINGSENETTFAQACAFFEQNVIGLSKQTKRHYNEIHPNLSSRLNHLKSAISPYYINNIHNSDAIYYSLTKLALISDDSRNLDKVHSILLSILLTWLSNSCYRNCAHKNTFSQLCQLFNNISSINLRGDSKKMATIQTAISALVFYVQKA